MIALLLACADGDPVAFTPLWYTADVVCEGEAGARWTPPTDVVWIASRYDAHGEDGNWYTAFGQAYYTNDLGEIAMPCNGGDEGNTVRLLYAVGELDVDE